MDFDDEEFSPATFEAPSPASVTVVEDISNPASGASTMEPPTRRSSVAIPEDTSVPVPHERSKTPRSKFILAMGLWAEDAGLSRAHWNSLREVLRLLEPHDEISKLPESITTIRKWARADMPLLPLREKKIPLLSAKLATMKPAAKSHDSSEEPLENLVFFDPIELFTRFLSAGPILHKMHRGFAHFVDLLSELWQSDSWASSARTTSGQFVYFQDQPIFPSDFIHHTCYESTCDCQNGNYHLGRVLAVGNDFRSNRSYDGPPGSLVLRLQKVIQHSDQSCIQTDIQPPMDTLELILVEDDDSLVMGVQSMIQSHDLNVTLDYAFGSRVPGRSHRLEQQQFVRRIWNPLRNTLRPLNHSHPIRAELEISEFTREHFVKKFNEKTQNSVISFPLLTFIDGFGLYRNMYRSLMGVYMIPAAFSFQERNRRANVLPLTLGPHGSNFGDVINSMHALFTLDGGQILKINQQDVFVSVFTLAYTGDMPQQAENCGFLGPRATRSCRSCFVADTGRSNLDFDILTNGRFHHKSYRMRKNIGTLRTMKQKSDYCRDNGLDTESPPLVALSPALDLVLTRPSDPAHSEYAGISKQLHTLLINAILTKAGTAKYGAELRKFPFPPGWDRLQSPIHHLGSYGLSEHARWSIIAPNLLRLWLKPSAVHPEFMKSVPVVFENEFPDLNQSPFACVNMIVACFAAVAKSNSLLMADQISADDASNFTAIVRHGRHWFKLLLEAAVVSAETNVRSRSHTPSSPRRTPMMQSIETPSTVPESSPWTTFVPRTAKGWEYRNDQKRPNFHVAMHYADVMKEYGLPSNCNVLIGEDKHRWFKKLVYTTNFTNVEKLLLSRESVRQTARLLLLGAYKMSEPEISHTFQELYVECPSLFDSLLPKSEQESQQQIVDETESFISIMDDSTHVRPHTFSRLQPLFCRDFLHLPIRSSALKHDMFHTFNVDLRRAYEQDYGMKGVMHLGMGAVSWSKKFSFIDKYVC